MVKIFLIIIFIAVGLSNSAFAQTGYGTDISGIIAIPTGINSEIYNTGFGGLAGFYYDVDEKIRIALVLGFITLGLDGDELNKKLEDAGEGNASISGSTNAIPVIISFRLITTGTNMRFYGLLEAGIYTYWSKAQGTYFPGDGDVPIDKSEFRSEPGSSVGGGVLFPLNEELNLNANLRYTFIQDSEYLNFGTTSVSTSQMFLFGIGLNWFFLL